MILGTLDAFVFYSPPLTYLASRAASAVAKSGSEELTKDNASLRAVNEKLQEALDAFQLKHRKTCSELDHAREISTRRRTDTNTDTETNV